MKKFYLLFLLLFIGYFFSCSPKKEIIGFYRCDNSGKKMAIDINSTNVAVISLIEMRQSFVDTVSYKIEKGLLHLTAIDTCFISLGDSLAFFLMPDKALFNKNYILFYVDSSFFLFYKVRKNHLNSLYLNDEFYYVSKQVSGEETEIIKKNFGDSLSIINSLQ